MAEVKRILNIEDMCHVLFEAAAEGLVVVDREGTILALNPRIEELFGYGRTELLGQSVEMLVPEMSRKNHANHRENYHKQPEKRTMGGGMDLSAQRKDGSLFPVEISLNHFEIEGESLVMALISDITRRKLADDELKKLNTDLEAEVKERTQELVDALEREREMNELKSRFVSTASHEFRTPLSAILSSAGLAEKYTEMGDMEKQQKHFSRIKSSVQNLTDILNDFLSLDKLEQGKVETQAEEFDLPEFVDDVIEELQAMKKENQKIVYTHTGDKEVELDKKILRNILLNLLSNAIKYSEKDVIMESNVADHRVTITVQDSGMGIPEEEQKHLFTMFFRANNATNIQGTGLGLNIVQRYVNLLHGTLDFNSTLDQGTTFTVKFPQNHV